MASTQAQQRIRRSGTRRARRIGIALLGAVLIGLSAGGATPLAHAQQVSSISGAAYGPDTCVNGYVWREAFDGDHVCVTPDVRSATTADNAGADDRFARNHLPYGPDTCVDGYVWRQANDSDHVCVTPDTRSQVADDNNQADSRVNPDGAYGPDSCIDGYVWREAFDGDHVCVTPDVRSATAADNAAADDRFARNHLAYGPDTCVDGYVWRQANDSDHVCVTPATRSQVAADNAAANSRYARNAQSAAPHIWLTSYAVTRNCNGDTCTATSDDDIPRIQVNGDHFTQGGKVFIAFTKISSGKRANTFTLTANFHSGYVQGSFGKKSGVYNCNAQANAPTNYTVRAYDYGTKTWSNQVSAKVCTNVL
jgi:hypothetical protein